MVKFTEENTRFRVVYTISEFWEFPDIDGDEFKWDGDEQVEQKLFGVLNARQFLWLIFDRQLTEAGNTMGIQIETDHIIPAVNFDTGDGDRGCYVSVYTDEMLKQALAQSDKPEPTPVLENDWVVRARVLGFINAGELWDSVVEALPVIIELLRGKVGYYGLLDGELDEMIPKLIDKLNESIKKKTINKEK